MELTKIWNLQDGAEKAAGQGGPTLLTGAPPLAIPIR
jgi:hypothetical protein